MSTLVFETFRGDSVAILLALWDFRSHNFIATWNVCDCEAAIWVSKEKMLSLVECFTHPEGTSQPRKRGNSKMRRLGGQMPSQFPQQSSARSSFLVLGFLTTAHVEIRRSCGEEEEEEECTSRAQASACQRMAKSQWKILKPPLWDTMKHNMLHSQRRVRSIPFFQERQVLAFVCRKFMRFHLLRSVVLGKWLAGTCATRLHWRQINANKTLNQRYIHAKWALVVMKEFPESEIRRTFSLTQAKNAARKNGETFLQIFAL